MNDLDEIDSFLSTLNENKFIDLILYGRDTFDDKKNHNILMITIKKTNSCYNYLSIKVSILGLLYIIFLF